MRGVSKSCLGGEAAINRALPHNYQITFVKSNTFHQLTLVPGCVGGAGDNDLEWEGSQKVVWVGRLQQIMFCLTIIKSCLQSQTHFINSPQLWGALVAQEPMILKGRGL